MSWSLEGRGGGDFGSIWDEGAVSLARRARARAQRTPAGVLQLVQELLVDVTWVWSRDKQSWGSRVSGVLQLAHEFGHVP